MFRAKLLPFRVTLLMIILATLMTGCSRDSYTENDFALTTSSSNPPNEVKLNLGYHTTSHDAVDRYIINKFAKVLDMSNGEVLGLIYDNDLGEKGKFSFETYPALYALDLERLDENNTNIFAEKVVEAEKGYTIANAGLNNNWIVWVETNGDRWKAYQLNRSTNEQIVLDEGELLNYAKDDFPNIFLDSGRAIINMNDKSTAKLVLYDLKEESFKEILKYDYAKGRYFGPPAIDKDNVVCHLTDRTSGTSEILFYDIHTEKVEQLNEGESKDKYPVVWDGYVAWLSTLDDKTEKLVVYNLDKKDVEFTFNLTKTNNYSMYRPSIANGYLVWNNITTSLPQECDINYFNILTKEKSTIKLENLYGVYIPNNLQIYDSWISYSYPQNMVPPPERPSSVVGSLLIKLK